MLPFIGSAFLIAAAVLGAAALLGWAAGRQGQAEALS
jgi:DHA1 family tetracycline resistance protein-like MFS transporter